MKGKHILLTGGTGGLGLGVTPAVLAQGAAAITIPYYNPKEVERLKAILSPAEIARIKFVCANLAEEASVENIINQMQRVDVLIHLVGGFAMGKTHEYSLENWKKDFDLNLTTTFLVCKHSLRRMLENRYGRIVTVGSRGAVEPSGQLAAYCASKAGVVALTKAIADETKGTNITANVVLPSVIDTPSNREAMGVENADKWVKAESLAQVICFLASEAAKDIRGAAVPVYGSV
ncbi:3-oxoacyl-ACP reductase FabG [Fischerella thermalis]|jgi:NAD(P)-dependent dehydrogenase (short-subunit alcohol dehydrogenase family)|uniref:Short-chain dehydrogenase/reductase SDR n=1 Tax=Fischerella thermalis JSC-11 TaxID=741277 RepID=G6FTF6_9CYAN|nr:3-oxoacyl-ACP reductase FabG [Fischerella thermalis]PLZ77647.1 3-oxoacyl-(ACP) reductase [Fischerella thermalis WC217]EHC13889.1 short-chain dehydrogenase/reductase SDR [Fischerella thermalis JSC-11]PLZ04930.1 3-oxoacyl-(ACP) reductase [Fischerella thermalis WC1110]PLZ08199.1 3-oxoacyl-(ACP) reductase [Fischerella thermalis WC119]PLZ14772.1 3-oxoacyl-(ACP) reductase [Fischerella thermalis WC114]